MFDKNGALCVLLWDVAGNPLVMAEDAAHVSGDSGIMALAVRKDAAAALAGTDGDYAPLEVDASGRLHMAPAPANSGVDIGDVDVLSVVPGTGAANLGKAEDAAHSSGDVGLMLLAVRKDSAAALAGADGDYAPLEVDASGRLHVQIYGEDANTVRVVAPADGDSSNNTRMQVSSVPQLYNAAVGLERERNNEEGTLLASAARTATTSSADQTNRNARGVRVRINVSALVDTPSVTVSIEEKDSISGNYLTILTSAAIATTGQKATLVVYPGNSAVANEKADHPLPRTWRVTVTHSDGDSITYSVDYAYIL